MSGIDSAWDQPTPEEERAWQEKQKQMGANLSLFPVERVSADIAIDGVVRIFQGHDHSNDALLVPPAPVGTRTQRGVCARNLRDFHVLEPYLAVRGPIRSCVKQQWLTIEDGTVAVLAHNDIPCLRDVTHRNPGIAHMVLPHLFSP